MNDTYKHKETGRENLTLHDCEATQARLSDGVLTFLFEDGFWIAPTHPENDLDTLVRTNKAKVDFHLYRGLSYDVVVYVFRRTFFKRTVREEMPLSRLIDGINSKKFTLEFLYQYDDDCSQMISCAIRSDRRPWYAECLMEIQKNGIEYFWNDLERDRVW